MGIVEKIDLVLSGQCSPAQALEVAVAVATDDEARAEFVWSLNVVESLRMLTDSECEHVSSGVRSRIMQIIDK